jgi:hypothetical protein
MATKQIWMFGRKRWRPTRRRAGCTYGAYKWAQREMRARRMVRKRRRGWA